MYTKIQNYISFIKNNKQTKKTKPIFLCFKLSSFEFLALFIFGWRGRDISSYEEQNNFSIQFLLLFHEIFEFESVLIMMSSASHLICKKKYEKKLECDFKSKIAFNSGEQIKHFENFSTTKKTYLPKLRSDVIDQSIQLKFKIQRKWPLKVNII